MFKTSTLVARKLPLLSHSFRELALTWDSSNWSLGHLLEQTAKRFPKRPAIVYQNQTLTYQQFNHKSNQLANYLLKSGLQQGDRVAVMMNNSPELLILVAGIVKAGGVAALINTSQREQVLAHSLKECDPSWWWLDEDLVEAFDSVRQHLDKNHLPRLQVIAKQEKGPNRQEWKAFWRPVYDSPGKSPESLKKIRFNSPCFYIFTSGTTGLPKASIMTHKRWIRAGAGFHATLANDEHDLFYVPLPMYHNNALTLAWGTAMKAGSGLLIRQRFSASHYWEDARYYQATVVFYIGEMCRYLMSQPPSSKDRQHVVRKMVGNGLRPDLWQPFKQRFGIEEVYEFYAASESNIAFVNYFNLDNTVGFCPLPYAIVEFDNEKEAPKRNAKGWMIPVKVGETGLLLGKVTRRYSFDGYTNIEESEKKLFRGVFSKNDVWYNSGDLMKELGLRHAQFVDRVGDTFRWKGENVSTTEVEHILYDLEVIETAVVYGVQVPNMDGRAGMAAICFKQGLAPDLKKIAQHLKRNLPDYAMPVFLRVISQLHSTETFKPKKSLLKQEGFDPAQIQDELYYRQHGKPSYLPLETPQWQQILAGSIRL